MSFADAVILAALLVCVILAVRNIRKHKGACCGNCADCRGKCGDEHSKE